MTRKTIKSFSVRRMVLMAENFIKKNPKAEKHIFSFLRYIHAHRDDELE